MWLGPGAVLGQRFDARKSRRVWNRSGDINPGVRSQLSLPYYITLMGVRRSLYAANLTSTGVEWL